MINKRLLRTMLTLILVVTATACAGGDQTGVERNRLSSLVDSLTQKDSVTILITDSGLGGLSVAAEIERRLHECHIFGNVRLVFANALPTNDRPYNSMADTKEKVETFSAALQGFADRFHPDMILIACNTLSVIYSQTEFSTQTTVPVFGIVDFGVDMVVGRLARDKAASAIILGTPTTAESGAHRAKIIAQGIDSNRVAVQACQMLESEIQADPSSDIVRTMIEMYAMESLDKCQRSDDGETVIALCCTHYGYARPVFEDVYSELVNGPVEVVDPNTAMSAALFDGAACDRHAETAVTSEVISRAELGDDDIASISRLLEKQSAPMAEALRRYTYDTALFAY